MKINKRSVVYITTWEHFRTERNGKKVYQAICLADLMDEIRRISGKDHRGRWRRSKQLLEIMKLPPPWWKGDRQEMKEAIASEEMWIRDVAKPLRKRRPQRKKGPSMHKVT